MLLISIINDSLTRTHEILSLNYLKVSFLFASSNDINDI